MCNNNICIPVVKSTAVAIVGGTLRITLPDGLSLINGKQWDLIICQAIPAGAAALPVQFVVAGIAYPAYCRLGNILRGDMIRSRKSYRLAYGWDVKHFIILSCNLCPSAFIPASAATETPTEPPIVTEAKTK